MTALLTLGSGSPALQSTTAEGTVTEQGETGTITIKTLGSSVRYEVSLPSQQFVSIFTNGVGKRIVNGRTFSLPSWMAEWKRPNYLPAISRLADVSLANTKVQLVGTEKVNGKPAVHLRISQLPTDDTPQRLLELISEFHVFIDQETKLVVKTTTFDFSPDAMENRTAIDTYFSDYRIVNGVRVPFHVTSYMGKQVQTDIVFNSVQLGAAVSEADFQ